MTFHALNTATLQEWRRQLDTQAPFFPMPVALANCLAGRDVGGLVGNSATSDTCMQPLEFDAESKGLCQPIFVTNEFIREKRKRKRGRNSGRARKSAGSLSQPETHDTQHGGNDEISKEHLFNIEFLDDLKMKLAQLERGSSYSQVDLRNELDALMRLPGVQMEGLLCDLHLSKLTEEALAGLCNQICEAEDVVYQNCVSLFQSTLLAKVRELTTAPSRILITSILNACKAKGKAVVDGLLLPLIHDGNIGRSQTDVVTRSINEGLSEISILALLRSILRSTSPTYLTSSPDNSVFWSDIATTVLLTLLNQKLLLDSDTIVHTLKGLSANIESDPQSKKLAQVLLTLVTRHGTALDEAQLRDVKEMASRNTTFLKKSVLAQVQMLEKSRKG